MCVLNVVGKCQADEDGRKKRAAGVAEAGRARQQCSSGGGAVLPAGCACLCPDESSSRRGALQLQPAPVALAITLVGMSNYYMLKHSFETVCEKMGPSGSVSSVCCRERGTLLSSMVVPCLANLFAGDM